MTDPVLYIEPGDADGIPVDVFVTITALLSKAWPGAMMTPGRSFGRGFGIALPGRAPKRVTKKAIAEATLEQDETAELGVLGWDGQTLSTVLPEELRDRLAVVAYTWITAFEGAVNYVEQHLTHPDHPDQRLTFTVQWVKGKTPHELRQEAESERDLLAQAMWDARGILGFDNDGDPTPAASVSGGRYAEFADQHVREASEARKDHDDALVELNIAPVTYEQVYRAWHGTAEAWGGCADKEAIDRIMELFSGRESAP